MPRGSYSEIGSSVRMLQSQRCPHFWHCKHFRIWFAVFGVALLVTSVFFRCTDIGDRVFSKALLTDSLYAKDGTSAQTLSSQHFTASNARERQPLSHVLIPASNPSPDLCKLLLTATALNYPQPSLLAWNDTFNNSHMMAGGSHIAKIHSTREALNQLGPENDEELVLMVDGYDVWFQLPPEVLANRYYSIVEQADARLMTRFGPEAMHEIERRRLGSGLSSKLIFAAGKRCAPNQPHTMACYALPGSPLPKDLYAGNTDSNIGHNRYYSYRQRFLNSGYVVGPVGAMRRLFEHTEDWVVAHENSWRSNDNLRDGGDPTDNGSNASEYFYHGSDQSIFARIWGRQEYVREELRRRWNPKAGGPEDLYKGTVVLEGTIVDDLLDPAWTHETWNQDPKVHVSAKSVNLTDHVALHDTDAAELLDLYDYGITLDYFSDLGHQTVNSERDARWLIHAKTPLASQLDPDDRSPFDCPTRLFMSEDTLSFPSDILNSPHPSCILPDEDSGVGQPAKSPWLSTSLYTHLCLSTAKQAKIPVMIHHNGDKSRRATTWHRMSWLYNTVRSLQTEQIDDSGDDSGNDKSFLDTVVRGTCARQRRNLGYARTDKGYTLSWDMLCPSRMLQDARIFGNSG